MAEQKRMIFQPDALTKFFIKEYTSHSNGTVGDIVNNAIHNYFIPKNEKLYREITPLLSKIKDGREEEISAGELQGTLSRCVNILKDYPIKDYDVLDQIMSYFRTGLCRAYRYDYPLIVNEFDDQKLHRLNEILKTVDSDFNIGTRELGERTRTIFDNWDKLCGYAEIYTHIARIIALENIYQPLDVYTVLCLVKMLDTDILMLPANPIAEEFNVNVTTLDKIHGIKYEILVYLTDNGYGFLTEDYDFHLPEEFREYYQDLRKTMQDYREQNEESLEEYYEDLVRLERKGSTILTGLARKNREKKFHEK